MEKIAKFNAEDPFLLSEQLTEEERMIADSARAYARENLLPRVTDMFINESDAPEIFTEMGTQGLLGVTIKPEYGGAGASYVSYGLVAREVESLYCDGPAGGGGVRRSTTWRVKTGSVLVPRSDVKPRVTLVTEDDL